MAVTAGGSPYVEASDLVADYPATSLALANKVDTKLDNAPTDNAQSGATYTFVLADARQLVSATNASAKTFTIPPQSSVTWLTGTMIRVVNYGAGPLTVNGGVGVTVTNTAATIAQYQAATAIRTGSNAWTLVPFSSPAVANANFSDVATGTYTDAGIDYKYITFNSTSTINISTAGAADILLVAGGGGSGGCNNSGGGGGGGGGYQLLENQVLAVGLHTIVVGAGGTAGGTGTSGGTGSNSQIYFSPFGQVALGGGGGGGKNLAGINGGSGGGGGTNNGAGGTGFQGFNGGLAGAAANLAGAGGGAGGLGGDGQSGGSIAGLGAASSITGTSVTRSAGGRGSFGINAGGANTGNGADGTNTGGTALGAAGGSGVVIVRVRT